MKTIEYLDAVKQRLAIASDYGLQGPLEVTKQTISRYRNGGTFDHSVAVRVAKILEVEPARVIADMELERTTDPQLQAIWRRIAHKVAAWLLAIGVAIGFASSPSTSSAASISHNQNSDATEIHIVRRLRQRGSVAFDALIAWLMGWARILGML